MLHKLVLGFVIVFLLALAVPVCHFVSYSQSVQLDNHNKVEYTLPHPGILPDHPLYFAKVARDRISEFMTRDPIQKAELYLLYADKRVAMSKALSDKGKTSLSVSTISKAQKYVQQIPPLLEQATEQGSAPSEMFLSTLDASNAKHRAVIESFIKDFPQGEIPSLNRTLEINEEVNEDLETLL